MYPKSKYSKNKKKSLWVQFSQGTFTDTATPGESGRSKRGFQSELLKAKAFKKEQAIF